MKRIVQKIEPAVILMPRLKRVCAYARVSLGTAHMLHSLAAQVSHYSAFIQNNREWEYAGVYADADETGTRGDRPEFQRMLADCRAGLVDMVVTKTISSFARNTVTLLETVRELKDLGVDIFFEEQGLHTLSGEGELLLTILASYAQEESRSVSENIKWRKRGDMKAGKTKPAKVYGYDVADGKLVINPAESEVVTMMFGLYLSGLGQAAIANRLNESGHPSAWGSSWSSGTVRRILTNPKMCGDVLHQRQFVTDHITKKQVKNRGELPMYLFEDAYEGIVSRETFDAVQAELKRRAGIGGLAESDGLVFRKMITCEICGRKFCHTSAGRGAAKCRAWACGGRDKRTGANCTAIIIPEPTLMEVSASVLGLGSFDGCVFTEKVERIIAHEGRRLTFVFKDGTEVSADWHRRKTIPYSKIGFDKRVGRNICYSIIGKGNGKIAERRKRKEAEQNAKRTDNPGE